MVSWTGLGDAVRVLGKFTLLITAFYAGLCIFIFFYQDRLLYRPAKLQQQSVESYAIYYRLRFWPLPNDATPCLIPALAKEYGIAWVGADWPGENRRGTMVVAHGNAGWAGERVLYQRALEPLGYRVLLYEYPGYGPRAGRPTQRRIASELGQIVRQLNADGLGPVYLVGESLGAGAVAAAIAANPSLPVEGALLITPWNCLAQVAAYHYPIFPVGPLLHDRYDNVINLAGFQQPVVVMLAGRDEIVPTVLGESLYKQLSGPRKRIVHPNATHNHWAAGPDAPWWKEAVDFLTRGSARQTASRSRP